EVLLDAIELAQSAVDVERVQLVPWDSAGEERGFERACPEGRVFRQASLAGESTRVESILQPRGLLGAARIGMDVPHDRRGIRESLECIRRKGAGFESVQWDYLRIKLDEQPLLLRQYCVRPVGEPGNRPTDVTSLLHRRKLCDPAAEVVHTHRHTGLL